LYCGLVDAKIRASDKDLPVQEKFMGLHGLLFFYGVLGIISCFWGLRKIPDNRGKSLVEVEEMYENDVDETKL